MTMVQYCDNQCQHRSTQDELPDCNDIDIHYLAKYSWLARLFRTYLLEGIHTQTRAVPGNKYQSLDFGQTCVAVGVHIEVKGRTLHSEVRGRGVARLRVVHLHRLQTVHLWFIHRGGKGHTPRLFTAHSLRPLQMRP